MSRQCQKLQLLIDHMAVSLKNKFACATVCICECVCVGWFFVAVASSGSSSSSSVRCHNYNEVRCSRALILLAFSSSSPCACCTPKRGTHTHTHSFSFSLSLSYTHLHLPRSNCHKMLNANWRLCALRESKSNDRFASKPSSGPLPFSCCVREQVARVCAGAIAAQYVAPLAGTSFVAAAAAAATCNMS